VQDQQVDPVNPELAGALVAAVQRLVVPVALVQIFVSKKTSARCSPELVTASPTWRSLP
jgi:hypothetical protein